MEKKVAIVLVNYKDYAQQYLVACRDSLLAQDYPSGSFQIYIVDNASSSESFEYLKVNYPEAIIIAREDGNYCAANNAGFSRAAEDACQYLVAANMDTVMHPHWLSGLVKALDDNPQAAIAQSKILLFPPGGIGKGESRINSLGNIIHFLGFGFTSGYGQADREIAGYPEISGYASGCSLMIRGVVWQEVGGYDEEYYMYHDDLELSLKVRLAGHRIILAPQSIIYHKYEFARSTRMVYYMERNRYLTMMTFFPSRLFALILLPALLMDIGLFFFSILGGWFRAELKVYAYFLRRSSYAKMEEKRRLIKGFAKVPFAELAKHFSGKIEFQEVDNAILKYLVNPVFNLYWRIVKRLI